MAEVTRKLLIVEVMDAVRPMKPGEWRLSNPPSNLGTQLLDSPI